MSHKWVGGLEFGLSAGCWKAPLDSCWLDGDVNRCRCTEALAGVVKVFYAERGGGVGGGVSASAVACLVGGQEEGRRWGVCKGNEMKKPSLPLQCIAPTPQPAIRPHSSSSWVCFTFQPRLIQAGRILLHPFWSPDLEIPAFKLNRHWTECTWFLMKETSDKLDLTDIRLF